MRSSQLDELLRRQAHLEEREARVADRERALGLPLSYPPAGTDDDTKPPIAGSSDAPRMDYSPISSRRPRLSGTPPLAPTSSSSTASAHAPIRPDTAYNRHRAPIVSGTSPCHTDFPASTEFVASSSATNTSGLSPEDRLRALEAELGVVRQQLLSRKSTPPPQPSRSVHSSHSGRSDHRSSEGRNRAPSFTAATDQPIDSGPCEPKPSPPVAQRHGSADKVLTARTALPSLPSLRAQHHSVPLAPRPAQPPYLDAAPPPPLLGRPPFDPQSSRSSAPSWHAHGQASTSSRPLYPPVFATTTHPNSSERSAQHPNQLPPIGTAAPVGGSAYSPNSAKRASGSYLPEDPPASKKRRSVGSEPVGVDFHHHARRDSVPRVKAESPTPRGFSGSPRMGPDGHHQAPSPAGSDDRPPTTTASLTTDITPLSERPPSPADRDRDGGSQAGRRRSSLSGGGKPVSLPPLSWVPTSRHGSSSTSSSHAETSASISTPAPAQPAPASPPPPPPTSQARRDESLTLAPLGSVERASGWQQRLPSLQSLP